MKFILLAISLFVASNGYAAILNGLYIYHDDSDEYRALKEKLKVAENESGETLLRLFKNNRKTAYHGYDKDEEVVYKAGDISKKDVSTKIGMTTDQVLNKTYWGKPENIYTTIDGNDKLELWKYEIHEYRYEVSESEGLLFFINGKLTHIIRFF